MVNLNGRNIAEIAFNWLDLNSFRASSLVANCKVYPSGESFRIIGSGEQWRDDLKTRFQSFLDDWKRLHLKIDRYFTQNTYCSFCMGELDNGVDHTRCTLVIISECVNKCVEPQREEQCGDCHQLAGFEFSPGLKLCSEMQTVPVRRNF